jgi:hypothetical protein
VLYTYFNNEEFHIKKYGEEAVQRHSELSLTQFKTGQPSYSESIIKHDLVDDETDLF